MLDLLHKKRVVDLTHLLLPGQEQYQLEVKPRLKRTGATGDIMSDVYFWSHVGTHVEVPLHFYADGKDTADLPLALFMGPAIRLDFRHKQVNEPITLSELQAAGDIQVGEHVILWEGRAHQYRTSQSHQRPYLSEEALEWLLTDRKMRLLGTDSSGFEVRGVSHFPNHRRLFKEDAAVLECLCNLEQIRHQHFYLIALPLPVRGLDACPVRAIAIEESDE
ncbi:cyclase family protein [Thermogemmatispora sp.]|uniref:cyclase family protein n=1 Tax=Thermogemmatispora sp. TaxID=1968838 RepID=UPI0035E427A5